MNAGRNSGVGDRSLLSVSLRWGGMGRKERHQDLGAVHKRLSSVTDGELIGFHPVCGVFPYLFGRKSHRP